MDNVANAIAVIGVYFALMAVLAVAVEIVIGWFKLIPQSGLQGTPSTDDVLNEINGWLPERAEGDEEEDDEADRAAARIIALNKALTAIDMDEIDVTQTMSAADFAAMVGQATTMRIQKERVRRAVIRLIAVLLGIVFAAILRIDTLELLGPLSQSAQELWLNRLGAGGARVVGIGLSGIAASAGSGFWHDQSARLRQLAAVAGAVGK